MKVIAILLAILFMLAIIADILLGEIGSIKFDIAAIFMVVIFIVYAMKNEKKE